MGDAARGGDRDARRAHGDRSTVACVQALNAYLFDDLGFTGNREQLRRPAQQLPERGARSPDRHPDHVVSSSTWKWRGAPDCTSTASTSPGHFLVRCPDMASAPARGLIIDPFHGGALLSEHDCRVLLQKHVGGEVAVQPVAARAGHAPQIIVRMLLNLKRIYVHMRSFPQARDGHRAAAGAHAVGAQRAARPRPARLSPQRRHGRAARPADLSEAVEHERDGRRSARRARADLGARQDAAAPRRVAQLGFAAPYKRWACCLSLALRGTTIRW